MAKFEVSVDDETTDLLRKLQAKKEKRGRKVTLAELAGEMVSTGVRRRQAADKWAVANAKPAKPRKPKAVKVAKVTKPKAPKTAKKPAAKTPKAKKAKAKPATVSAADPTPAAITPTPDPMS